MNKTNYENDRIKYGEIQQWQINIDGRIVNCEALRNLFGAWCGYVYYNGYNGQNIDKNNIDVHGGITYDNGTKMGFDCCHSMDYKPYTYIHNNFSVSVLTYRDFPYVKVETEKLARQIFSK
jgi:hypothetical protein